MANFSYNDYQQVIAKAQSGEASSNVKIGFFKMKNDGDEALVRINVKSLDDLMFTTVHQLGAAQKWMKVSCLNPVGSYFDSCPLCAAVSGGAKDIGKAAKKVYVQMLVSYKDVATQTFSAAIPVIWERPAGFSREIANLLNDYGDLSTRVFKVTRNGAAGSMQTTYSISYIPLYDKPESVSTDFGAFNNFNIAKHSFWEKTAGEISVFLNTGAFPEVNRQPNGQSVPTPTDADTPAYPTHTANATATYVAPAAPQEAVYTPPVVTEAPTAAPTTAPTYVPGVTTPTEMPTAPITPVEAPAPAQPIGADFGRAPRTFGGLSF